MKKLITFVLLFVSILSLVGCTSKEYQLPHDQFCYSADGTITYELSDDDQQYIIDLLNDAVWINAGTNCVSDFVFYTQKQEIRYSSKSGTFNDYTNKRSTTLSEEQRIMVNTMLGID